MLGSGSDKIGVVFTFLTEKEGTTFIEQFVGENINDAILSWVQGSESKPGALLEGTVPVTINNTRGVWFISGFDPGDVFFLVNIVATRTDFTFS